MISEPPHFEFSVHPLVLLNVCDHVTRARLQQHERHSDGSVKPAVHGVLLGKKVGHEVQICSSFEILMGKATSAANAVPDMELLRLRLEQYRTVLPALELVGCYVAVGGKPIGSDEVGICAALVDAKICAVPFLGILDYAMMLCERGNTEIPIRLYVYDHGLQTLRPAHVAPVRIVTDDAEYVALESAMNDTSGDSSSSSVAKQQQQQQCSKTTGSLVASVADTAAASAAAAAAAVAALALATSEASGISTAAAVRVTLASQLDAQLALAQRVRQIATWVGAVCDGRLPADQKMLREIAGLVQRRPTGNPYAFERNGVDAGDRLESKATECMAFLTKNLNKVHKLAQHVVWEQTVCLGMLTTVAVEASSAQSHS